MNISLLNNNFEILININFKIKQKQNFTILLINLKNYNLINNFFLKIENYIFYFAF